MTAFSLRGKEVTMQTRWVWWIALMHVSLFGLCLMGALGKASRARSIMLVATGVWFLLQGVDEVLMGNFFRSGLIEYPILVVYWVGTILYIKRYDHATR